MNWKFWEKENNKTNTTVKHSKPKDLPSTVGKHLVVALKYDPDWVWSLKTVMIPKEPLKGAFTFRVFDPIFTNSKGIKIQNYYSFDEHLELIYFEGWYNKNTDEITLNDRYKSLKQETAA
jgi:hypothetical protein